MSLDRVHEAARGGSDLPQGGPLALVAFSRELAQDRDLGKVGPDVVVQVRRDSHTHPLEGESARQATAVKDVRQSRHRENGKGHECGAPPETGPGR